MTPALSRALELHTPQGILPLNPSPEQTSAFRKANQLRASLLNDSWPTKVLAFRRLFGLSAFDNTLPALIPANRQMLHRRLIDEERDELFDAFDQHDLEGIVDGCLDLIYVTIGALIEHGFTPQQIELMMQEVHASNMTKTDDIGQPVFDDTGKVLKGDNYIPVNLHDMIVRLSVGLEAEEPSDG
jgi:predicted HAD superfamily Cof-like phosphohydrolase